MRCNSRHNAAKTTIVPSPYRLVTIAGGTPTTARAKAVSTGLSPMGPLTFFHACGKSAHVARNGFVSMIGNARRCHCSTKGRSVRASALHGVCDADAETGQFVLGFRGSDEVAPLNGLV